MQLWQIPDSVVESSLLGGERVLPDFFVSEDYPGFDAECVQDLSEVHADSLEALSVAVESILYSKGYSGGFTVNYLYTED